MSIIDFPTSERITGFVRLNGRTIGTSNRIVNAGTEELFTLCWSSPLPLPEWEGGEPVLAALFAHPAGYMAYGRDG